MTNRATAAIAAVNGAFARRGDPRQQLSVVAENGHTAEENAATDAAMEQQMEYDRNMYAVVEQPTVQLQQMNLDADRALQHAIDMRVHLESVYKTRHEKMERTIQSSIAGFDRSIANLEAQLAQAREDRRVYSNRGEEALVNLKKQWQEQDAAQVRIAEAQRQVLQITRAR